MTSVVGETLAVLQLRASRNVLELGLRSNPISDAEREDLRWQVFDSFLRFDFTMAALRPLFEGLALFAEFDSTPGDTELIIPTSFWIARSYCAEYFSDVNQMPSFNGPVRQKLATERLKRRVLDRKESVLAEPFEAVRDGYLASYLFIKDLWTTAVEADSRFHDKDLFVACIKRHFFDDLGLVAELLDNQTSDLGAVGAISAYYKARMDQLFLSFSHLADWVLGEIELVQPGDLPGKSIGREAGLSRLQAEPGANQDRLDLISSGAAELTAEIDGLLISQTSSAVASLQAVFLAQRKLFHIGSTTVNVTVSESGRYLCLLDDFMLASGPVHHSLDHATWKGTHDGLLSLYMLPYEGIMAMSVTVDSHLVSVVSVPNMSHIDQELESFILDASAILGQSDGFSGFSASFVSSDGSMMAILETCRDSIQSWYQKQFVGRWIDRLSTEIRDVARLQLNNAGLGSALGGSRKDLRLLTWLSLAASSQIPLALVEQYYQESIEFHQYEGDLMSAIRHIQGLGGRYLRDELLFVSNNTFWSAV